MFCCGVLHQKFAVKLYQSGNGLCFIEIVCVWHLRFIRTVKINKFRCVLKKFRNWIRTSSEIRKPYTQTAYTGFYCFSRDFHFLFIKKSFLFFFFFLKSQLSSLHFSQIKKKPSHLFAKDNLFHSNLDEYRYWFTFVDYNKNKEKLKKIILSSKLKRFNPNIYKKRDSIAVQKSNTVSVQNYLPKHDRRRIICKKKC